MAGPRRSCSTSIARCVARTTGDPSAHAPPMFLTYPQAPPANAHAPRANNAGFADDDAWEPLPPLIPGPESITVVPYPRRRVPRAWRRIVAGDGSCFFHAVGQWTGEPAQALRDRVCDYGQQQLTDEEYMPYMDNLMEDEDWGAGDVLPRIERFEKMREPGRFADYLDVMITATVLRRPIAVLVRARRNGMLGPFVNYQVFWPDGVPQKRYAGSLCQLPGLLARWGSTSRRTQPSTHLDQLSS